MYPSFKTKRQIKRVAYVCVIKKIAQCRKKILSNEGINLTFQGNHSDSNNQFS